MRSSNGTLGRIVRIMLGVALVYGAMTRWRDRRWSGLALGFGVNVLSAGLGSDASDGGRPGGEISDERRSLLDVLA